MNVLTSGIFNKLKGDAGLIALLANGVDSVFYEQAPDNETYPYVVFNIQGGGDLNISPARIKEDLFFVRGYTKASPAAAGLIDAQIDALLHEQTITVTGWGCVDIQREQDIENIEDAPNGEKIYMAGGVYRIQVDQD
jgi:hypothetical protein